MTERTESATNTREESIREMFDKKSNSIARSQEQKDRELDLKELELQLYAEELELKRKDLDFKMKLHKMNIEGR